MPTAVLVGLQWGDEGKAKIVDLFTASADVIVRYSGGANAGHTVVVEEEKFVFHLVPAGILHRGRLCVIANGVVVDVKQLVSEIDLLRSRGVEVDGNLRLSSRCHLTLPFHKAIEREWERSRGSTAIGTTLRGVGPTFVDKFAREGILVCDLFREELLMEKLKRSVATKNLILSAVGSETRFEVKSLFEELLGYAKRLKPYVCDTSLLLSRLIGEGKRILFEGAQGTMLDIEHGTYPYVTTSYPTSGGVCVGCGIGPGQVGTIIGVVKAYSTRVGAGPLPTEDTGDGGLLLSKRGNEFGATTGRPRRCGWLDLVALRYAARVNGVSSIVITKLDVLDSVDEIPVCTQYRYEGQIITEFPPELDVLQNCVPVYTHMPGWRESTRGLKEVSKLPENANAYLKRIEEELGVPVSLVSTGPGREENIVLNEDLLPFR